MRQPETGRHPGRHPRTPL